MTGCWNYIRQKKKGRDLESGDRVCVSCGLLGSILVHLSAILGHLRAILGYSGAILGCLAAILSHFGASLGQSWLILAHLGLSWGSLVTLLGHLGAILGHLGAILRHLGGILGPRALWKPPSRISGAPCSPSCFILGPVLETKVEYFWT